MRRGSVLGVMVLALLMLGSCGRGQNGDAYIGVEQAKQLALDACGMTDAGADSIAVDQVTCNGQHCYQVDITAAGQSYHYDIDALTGVIVAMSSSAVGNSANDGTGAGQSDQMAQGSAGQPGQGGTGQSGQGDAGQSDQMAQGSAGQPGQTTPGQGSAAQTTQAGVTGHHPDEHHSGQAGAQTASDPAAGGSTASGMITLEDAKAKVLAHAGLTADQVTFVENKLDYENGRQVYELEFYTADYREYEYEIDAYTGDVVGYDHDAEHHTYSQSAGSGAITADDAKALALAKVPGATDGDIREFEADYDDGRLEYEGKIIYNGIEYEFEIDGSSGQFLKWEKE